MFKNLSEKPIAELQLGQADAWKEENLLEKCVTTREGQPQFIFYEGPPTANGRPGIHHVMARTLKDSVCRYKTMQGFQVRRKAGWDTHGLPVEIEVEKQLKMTGKQDIEKYGIKEFNEKCRESVFSYESLWREMTHRMGYLVDLDNPYITLDNNYIETGWWILKEFFKKGMIYEGHKILPYCPRCGTGLASHEVAQGYKEVKVLTLTVKFKKKDADNEYFLAWTTTPWTLAANVALTVHADVDYIKVKMLDGENEGNIFYLAKELAGKALGDAEYEILEEMKGKDLEYMEYEQIMPFINVDKKAFFVTCADYVTTGDGTGIVHTAPAFGEDDYNTGRRYDLPVINPVDEDGKYTETPWVGRFVMEEGLDVDIVKYLAQDNKIFAKEKMIHNYPHCWRCGTPLIYYGRFVMEEGLDVDIVKYLAQDNKIFAKEKMIHNYPHCWRCGTPLIYYAKPSWYIEMSKLKDELVANNNTVNWYPDFVGEKRFGNWLAEVKDWPMTRIPEVMDCWFDSGAMPFAQQHYPFENKEKFDEQMFPADFICEGIDQTRGWFYSLMAISTFLKGKAPYKNVLVNDLILDKTGKKMSKSKGNTVDPFELFDKYGADAARWYLLYSSPAWTPTKFDEDGLVEIVSKFFGTIKNVYNFFVLYSNQDNINPKEFDIPVAERPELDRWIISRFNRVIKEVTEYMDGYDHMRSVRTIQDFVTEDLSNWYIRRARRRFWGEELTEDKKAVYKTTYEVLVGVAELMAPFAPFLADEIYINLTDEESVHLGYYPKADESLIDEKSEERMDIVRTLVGLGRGTREKEKIKVRQPLKSVLVDGKYEALISDLTPLIEEELNIKEVHFEKDLGEYMNYQLKPNFKVAGPVLGKNIKEFGALLAKADPTEYVGMGTVKVTLGGEEFDITSDMIDVKITAKEGFAVAMENNVFTILDTNLNQELLDEGIAREIVSKVQQLRKQHDFEMMDNIAITLECDDEVKAAVEKHKEYIMSETLAVTLEAGIVADKLDINGHETGINVVKK